MLRQLLCCYVNCVVRTFVRTVVGSWKYLHDDFAFCRAVISELAATIGCDFAIRRPKKNRFVSCHRNRIVLASREHVHGACCSRFVGLLDEDLCFGLSIIKLKWTIRPNVRILHGEQSSPHHSIFARSNCYWETNRRNNALLFIVRAITFPAKWR